MHPSHSATVTEIVPQRGVVFVEQHPYLECFEIMVEWADQRVERVSGGYHRQSEAFAMALQYAFVNGLLIEHAMRLET